MKNIHNNCRVGKQRPALHTINNSYTAADRGRRSFANWSTSNGDADADIIADLPALRQRSRDLIRNNGLAGGAVATNVTSVVGSGLMLQSTIDRAVLNLSDDQADAWESRTEREFALFAKHCDLNRSLSFYGIQELVFRSVLENGDVFTLAPWRQRGETPYETKLKVVEADRIGNKDGIADRVGLTAGIQKDADGAPTHIHIMKHHPGNRNYAAQSWDVVPVFGAKSGRRQVIHNYFTLRPDQSRGVPYLSSIIELLKQLGRYTEAEIMAAVVSAMFTVFVKTETGQGGPFQNGGGSYAPASAAKPTDTKSPLNLGNGMVVDLAKGEDITIANPGRPNPNFDPFILAITRQIGVRLEIPFELLIKHFTSSYSASRASLNEAWKYFMKRRTWLADYFCRPVYQLFMDEAVSKGRIAAPGYFTDPIIREAYLGSKWTGPGKGQINEFVEVKAAAMRVDKGFSTIAQETAQINGGNFERNHTQRVKEQGLREAAKLVEPIVPIE